MIRLLNRGAGITFSPHDFLVLRVLSNQMKIALGCLAILGYMTVNDAEQPDILVGALVATLGQAVGSMTSFLTSTGPKTSPDSPFNAQGKQVAPLKVEGVPEGEPVPVETEVLDEDLGTSTSRRRSR